MSLTASVAVWLSYFAVHAALFAGHVRAKANISIEAPVHGRSPAVKTPPPPTHFVPSPSSVYGSAASVPPTQTFGLESTHGVAAKEVVQELERVAVISIDSIVPGAKTSTPEEREYVAGVSGPAEAGGARRRRKRRGR